MSDGATPKTKTAEFDYSILDPYYPASIQALIDFHRMTFGGATMEADAAGTQEEAPDPGADPKGTETEDELLGEGGKKALAAERKARQALEAQVKELAPMKDTLARLTAALGADHKGATPEAAIADITSRFDKLQDDLGVERLARLHGITDEKDIVLLRSTSADARSDLAARLKPGTNPPNPKPDKSAARGASGEGKATSVATGRDLYAERHGKKTT